MSTIVRQTRFTGKRKIGLDTNILIYLYDQPHLYEYEETRIFRFNDTVFTHSICIYELAKHIKKKEKYNKIEEALEEAKRFIKEKKITKIYYKPPKNDLKKFEDESNKRLNQLNKKYLKCHWPDSLILLGFKKLGVNKVISTDEGFRICAIFLGMDGSSIPSLNTKIKRELRSNYVKKYKKKHRKKRKKRS